MAHRHRQLVLLLMLLLAAASVRVAAAAEAEKININTASATELTALNRIGPVTADRIVAYREKHGPFKSVEELVAVRGIGPKTLESFRDRITVGAGQGKAGRKKGRSRPSS